MMVRRLLFLPRESVNAVSLFHPYLTPTLSPLSLTSCVLVQCPPHHSTSLSLACLSQFSLFIPLPVCALPLSSNTPLPPSLTQATCCLWSYETFWEEKNDRGRLALMLHLHDYVSSINVTFWSNGITLSGRHLLHATGREPFSSQLNIHNIASS